MRCFLFGHQWRAFLHHATVYRWCARCGEVTR